jgi:hypothetical protein
VRKFVRLRRVRNGRRKFVEGRVAGVARLGLAPFGEMTKRFA